jgi:large subunit ribosomal protein L6
MSRIGSRRITVPSTVTITPDQNHLLVTGPKGKLVVPVHPRITVSQENDMLTVDRTNNDGNSRALHGLTQVLIQNAVQGVTEGFTKRLELHGIGYRAQTDGKSLTLAVGYTHPIIIQAPNEISFNVEKNTLVSVTGIDKQLVGQVAANIRSVRKPEPYKGKGIRYSGELVRRKAGKAAKAGK